MTPKKGDPTHRAAGRAKAARGGSEETLQEHGSTLLAREPEEQAGEHERDGAVRQEGGEASATGHGGCSGGLNAKNVPRHIGAQFLAGHDGHLGVALVQLTKRAFDDWAVLSRERAVREKPRRDVPTVLVAEQAGESRLPTERSGRTAQRQLFWGAGMVHKPNLTSFDLNVKSLWTVPTGLYYPPWMGGDKPITDPDRQGFGMRLKAAREARGLTQLDVAKLFDVTKGTVSAWETGGGLPDAMRLRRLARLYQVSADALLWENALSNDAMQFAAVFDSLTERQRMTLKTVMLAFVQEATADARVEEAFGPAPGDRRTGQAADTYARRRATDQEKS